MARGLITCSAGHEARPVSAWRRVTNVEPLVLWFRIYKCRQSCKWGIKHHLYAPIPDFFTNRAEGLRG